MMMYNRANEDMMIWPDMANIIVTGDTYKKHRTNSPMIDNQ